jgi:capsular exopolysaccharide synthesis family protein
MMDRRAGAETGMMAIDPKEIMDVVRRYPWVPLLFAAAGGLTLWGLTARQPTMYLGVASVIIDAKLPKVLGDNFDVDPSQTRLSAEETFYITQYNIMKGRSVLRDTATRARLASDPEFLADYGLSASSPNLERSLENVLRSMVEIEARRKTNIVEIQVRDVDPNRAARIANTIAEAYIEQSLEQRLSDSRGASQWLDSQVEEFASKLDEAERNLQEFKQRHMLVSVSVEDRKNMVSTSLTTLNEKLVQSRARLVELKSERTALSRAQREGGAIQDSFRRVRTNGAIQRMKTELGALHARKAELQARYERKHPSMVATDQQIQSIRSQLEEEVAIVVAGLDNDIAELETLVAGLEGELERAREEAMTLNDLALDYTRLSRNVGTLNSTYQSLLRRRTETELSSRLESNFVRWHEPAEAQMGPIGPMVWVNTWFGGFLGLVLGVLLLAGQVLLDTTLHDQTDIENQLGVLYLGLLPKVGERRAVERRGEDPEQVSRDRDLYISRNLNSPAAECARSIRTNLLFLGTDRALKTILVTSAGPAEGKSTTAVALATTMALAGNRVLLVDTDLRRPRLHRTFGIPGAPGLTELLLQKEEPAEVLRKTEVASLDLLPGGLLPPNPAELLHSARFSELVATLSETYDRIIFDSPPIGVVTDPVILSQQLDGSLLVVKANKTTKDAARRAMRKLRDVDAHVLGAIINNFDLSRGGHHEAKYYAYGYGYTPRSDHG